MSKWRRGVRINCIWRCDIFITMFDIESQKRRLIILLQNGTTWGILANWGSILKLLLFDSLGIYPTKQQMQLVILVKVLYYLESMGQCIRHDDLIRRYNIIACDWAWHIRNISIIDQENSFEVIFIKMSTWYACSEQKNVDSSISQTVLFPLCTTCGGGGCNLKNWAEPLACCWLLCWLVWMLGISFEELLWGLRLLQPAWLA